MRTRTVYIYGTSAGKVTFDSYSVLSAIYPPFVCLSCGLWVVGVQCPVCSRHLGILQTVLVRYGVISLTDGRLPSQYYSIVQSVYIYTAVL